MAIHSTCEKREQAMTANNDRVHHMTAIGISVGRSEAAHSTPMQRRRQRRPTLAAAVKVAKRAGADRVEIDQKSGRIVIPLTGNGGEQPGDAELENPWDVVLPGGPDGTH
jgi:hypothetical protein